PKGDFLSLFKHAEWLRLDPSKLKLINLRDPHASVSLDPFGVAEVDYQSAEALRGENQIDDRALLARSTLFSLLRMTTDKPENEQRKSLIRAAVKIEMEKAPTALDVKRLIERDGPIPIEEEPCLQGVMDTLESWALGKRELPSADLY